jgi:hypothetical protein
MHDIRARSATGPLRALTSGGRCACPGVCRRQQAGSRAQAWRSVRETPAPDGFLADTLSNGIGDKSDSDFIEPREGAVSGIAVLFPQLPFGNIDLLRWASGNGL